MGVYKKLSVSESGSVPGAGVPLSELGWVPVPPAAGGYAGLPGVVSEPPPAAPSAPPKFAIALRVSDWRFAGGLRITQSQQNAARQRLSVDDVRRPGRHDMTIDVGRSHLQILAFPLFK